MQSEYKYAEDLIEMYPGLTQYEALTLAIGMKRNAILKSAFMVGYKDYPVALESIGMALGFSAKDSGDIRQSLDGIANQIELLRDAFDEQFKIS